MSNTPPECRHLGTSSRGNDAIIAAMVTILLALEAGTIIANATGSHNTSHDNHVMAIPSQIAIKTREAKTPAATVVNRF